MLAVEGRIVLSLQMFIYRIGISAMVTDGEEQSVRGGFEASCWHQDEG